MKDDVYVWLPAAVQLASSGGLTKDVRVVLPDNWAGTTILYDQSSIKELEYVSENHEKLPSSVGNGNTISSPQSGSKDKCHVHVKNTRSRRIYSYEKKQIEGIPGGIMRSISLQHYPNGALPIQNIKRQSDQVANTHRTSIAIHL